MSGKDQAWIPVNNSRVNSFQEDGHNICINYSYLDFSFLVDCLWILPWDSSPFGGSLGFPRYPWRPTSRMEVAEFFQNGFPNQASKKTSKIQGSQQNDCRERLQICSLRKMILQSQETMTQNLHPSNSRWI